MTEKMWYKRIEQGHFELVCRLCLRKLLSSKVPIFEESTTIDNEESIKVPELIKYCTDIKVSQNDQLPKFICTVCKNKLLQYTKFRQKCFNSKEILENILQNIQSTIKIESEDNREKLVQEENNVGEFAEINENQSTPIENSEDRTIKDDDFIDPLNIQSLLELECIELEETKPELKRKLKNTKTDGNQQLEEIQNEKKTRKNTQKLNSSKRKSNKQQNKKKDDADISIEKPENESLQQIKNTDNPNMKKKRNRIIRQCPICGKMYRDLSHHISRHDNIKNFKCTVCNGAFRKNYQLIQHMLIHSNERSFKCNYCEKGFNSKNSLKVHQLQHTQEMNYKCDVCGFKFLYYSTLRYHKKLHFQNRPHKCDICSKDFIAKSDLRQHYHIHTGEKPYECKECDKKFAQRSALSLHRKTHSKEIVK